MTTPTHGRRPNLAPTSPLAGGDLHTGDLAPRPLPVGGEVSTGSPTATTTNTPTPRPRGDVLHHPDCPTQHPAPITYTPTTATVELTICTGCRDPR